MTDNNSDGRTYLQGSIKEQHRQGSLHPADSDMLMDSVSSKGHSQKRLSPSEQSSLSGEPAETPVQRSLTGEGENRKAGGQKVIIPMAITFALGLLVASLIFRMVYKPSEGINESTATSAEKELSKQTIAPDDTVEIPDPVLKKAIQDTLGIGDREITKSEALSMTKLEYNAYAKNRFIKDITGLSAFKNLTKLILSHNDISDISALSGLTKLKTLRLQGNEISDVSALAGLTNLTLLDLRYNDVSEIHFLSGLTNLMRLYLSSNQISDINALSGLTKLTRLNLGRNQVSDINALSGLTNLTILYLYNNQVSDISALSGLTNLTELDLHESQVSDIDALSDLTNLTILLLYGNQISDINALSGLTKLYDLRLENNQINDINALSDLTNLNLLFLDGNPVLENKSRGEIMEVLSGAENLREIDF